MTNEKRRHNRYAYFSGQVLLCWPYEKDNKSFMLFYYHIRQFLYDCFAARLFNVRSL